MIIFDTARTVIGARFLFRGGIMSKTYNSKYSYTKDNFKYIDRYGDAHYKRKIKKVIVNRYGDVTKIIAK